MGWLLAALQVVLSATLVLAATGKLLQSDDFVAALRLSHLPEALVLPLAFGVPVLEVALGVLLVLTPTGRLPAVVAASGLLLAAFTLWMGWVRLRRLHVRCGCFGGGGGDVGPRTIGRNLVLLVLAVAGFALARTIASPLPAPSLPMVMAVSSFGLAIALLAALRFAWPHLVVTFDRFQANAADGE